MKNIGSTTIGILFLTLSSTQAIAQTTYLSLADQLKAAELEKTNTLNAIAGEADKGTGINVCLLKRLQTIADYDQWFIDHYQDFCNFQASYLDAAQNVEAKLAQLQNESVKVLPEKSQSKEVTLTFAAVVDYFKKFNLRYKSTPVEKRAVLLELQKDPRMNPPLYVAHEQVLAAMRLLATNINASLKQRNEAYEIVFETMTDGVDLRFVARAGTSEVLYSQSLLDGKTSGQAVQVADEEQVWKRLAGQKHMIDGKSVFGIRRFFDGQKTHAADGCGAEGKIQYVHFPDHYAAFVPVSQFEALRKLVKVSPLEALMLSAGRLPIEKWDFAPTQISIRGQTYWIGVAENSVHFGCVETGQFSVHSLTNALNFKDPRINLGEYKGQAAIRYMDQFRNHVVINFVGERDHHKKPFGL